MANLPPESASHLRFARVWGLVVLMAWGVVGVKLALAKPGEPPPTALLSTAAGLIVFAGALAVARGRRARCAEGYVWMGVGIAAVAGFAALVLLRVVTVVQ